MTTPDHDQALAAVDQLPSELRRMYRWASDKTLDPAVPAAQRRAWAQVADEIRAYAVQTGTPPQGSALFDLDESDF